MESIQRPLKDTHLKICDEVYRLRESVETILGQNQLLNLGATTDALRDRLQAIVRSDKLLQGDQLADACGEAVKVYLVAADDEALQGDEFAQGWREGG